MKKLVYRNRKYYIIFSIGRFIINIDKDLERPKVIKIFV